MRVTWLVAALLLAPVARADEGAELPARIEVRNEMSDRFRLVEVRLSLDGREIARRVASPEGELERTFRAWEGTIEPGAHRVVAELVFEGRNRGPFTYLDDYQLRARAELAFVTEAREGPAALDVVARERRGPDVPFEQRPVIVFEPAPGSVIPPPERLPRRQE